MAKGNAAGQHNGGHFKGQGGGSPEHYVMCSFEIAFDVLPHELISFFSHFVFLLFHVSSQAVIFSSLERRDV